MLKSINLARHTETRKKRENVVTTASIRIVNYGHKVFLLKESLSFGHYNKIKIVNMIFFFKVIILKPFIFYTAYKSCFDNICDYSNLYGHCI